MVKKLCSHRGPLQSTLLCKSYCSRIGELGLQAEMVSEHEDNSPEARLTGLRFESSAGLRARFLKSPSTDDPQSFLLLDHFLDNAYEEIEEYLDGKRFHFTIPIRLYGTEFQRRVWQVLLTIPYGGLSTYSELAKAIGAENACRAVGGALNRNPIGIIVPCHRVIGKRGDLVGFAGGVGTKQQLIELETGIKTG